MTSPRSPNRAVRSSHKTSAQSLLDRLPKGEDELVEGGVSRVVGRIKTFEVEADAEYGPQVHAVTTTDQSKTGKWENWWGLGSSFARNGKVVASSKGGIFVAHLEELLGSPIPWTTLEGKYWALEKESHDYGDYGVREDFFPVEISSKPIAEEAPDKDDDPDPDANPDDEDEVAGYPSDVVDAALALMDGKKDRTFRTRAARSRPLAPILDDINAGTFQEAMIDEGLVELDDEDAYRVPEDDAGN